jgi:RNA polymerase sigma-B factor
MGGDSRERSAGTPAAMAETPGPPDNARQDLVRSHLPLVRAMARRYGGQGEEIDDLVQVGALALIKASGRFDPSRGIAFASFAAPAVEGEIRRHLRERGRGLRLPRATQRMSNELTRSRAALAAALGRSPTVHEMAAALDADVAEVERLIAADLARDPVAISAGEAAGELRDDHESTAESEARVLLAGGLRALDERERRIVFLRFHADMTERQIARTVGLSQAHVSRLLEGALTKLRIELTSQGEPAVAADSTDSHAISANGSTKADTESAAAPSRRRPARPRPATGYSGRILVRMPSELHEQLAQAAERTDVSLNRYVTQALSSAVGTGNQGEVRPARVLRLAVATNAMIVVVAAIVAVVLLVLALQQGI